MADNFNTLINKAINNNPIKVSYDELIKLNLNINPVAFANEVLMILNKFAIKDLTNLKLQKLLYYWYGIALKKLEKPLFLPIEHCSNNNAINNIDFWALGPVIVPVYQELKHYGNEPLISKFSEYSKILLKDVTNKEEQNPAYEIVYMHTEEEHLGQIRDAIVFTI